MEKTTQIIYIQPEAPAKPREGAPCNGCGVCCLSEPCPLGMILSRKRSGACTALRWSDALAQYRCGALTEPEQIAKDTLPHGLTFAYPMILGILHQSAERWIAAGKGCDCSLETPP